MKKSFYTHEIVYQSMAKNKIGSWDKSIDPKRKAIDPDSKRFLIDVLFQSWAPKKGKVMELGCGTGPISRMILKKGFSVTGVDVSKTAIKMAKKQTAELKVKFRQADICDKNFINIGKFDIVVDGHCLHCIVSQKDRLAAFKNSFNVLEKGGMFVLMSMCKPVDKKILSQNFKNQKVVKDILYIPCNSEFEGSCTISGVNHVPIRRISHWKKILTEVKEAGFLVKLFRHSLPAGNDPFGSFFVAAIKL